MGNLTIPAQIPAWVATPLLTQSLTPQQRSKHRAEIGVIAEASLHSYWKVEPSAPVKEEMLRQWMEGLENFHTDEIRAAFKCHLSDNPKIRPNVGYIRKYVMANRALNAPKVVAAPEPKRAPPSVAAKKRADNILRNAGFGTRAKK